MCQLGQNPRPAAGYLERTEYQAHVGATSDLYIVHRTPLQVKLR
ncbi:hypothetical protein IW245_007266 [Longispora fulva]|uniref:Uncharacterized protein n=1 Tax=Longispora fulva TaxID=619741 RepID=A0A8J7KTS8_9ACTN|nr:hypothetical protein [Longispora fulva]